MIMFLDQLSIIINENYDMQLGGAVLRLLTIKSRDF